MGKLLFVLGGARSGKSTYARKYLEKNKGSTLFIATARPSDPEMVFRINNHKKERDKNWQTIEMDCNFKTLETMPIYLKAQNILVDCITLLVNNQMFDSGFDWNDILPEDVQKIEHKILNSINELINLSKEKQMVIVSNEVGMGIVPDNMFAIYFRDILGRINQVIAKQADEVIFMLAGIPIKIKGDRI